MLDKIKARPFLSFSVVLFLVSLPFIAFHTAGNFPSNKTGFDCLLMGWLVVIGGGSSLVWLANPLLFFSWYNVKRNPSRSFYFSLASFLIAISFLFFKKAMLSSAGDGVIAGYGLSYWLWIASHFLILVKGILFKLKS